MSDRDTHPNRYWLPFSHFQRGHTRDNHPTKSLKARQFLWFWSNTKAQRDNGTYRWGQDGRCTGQMNLFHWSKAYLALRIDCKTEPH